MFNRAHLARALHAALGQPARVLASRRRYVQDVPDDLLEPGQEVVLPNPRAYVVAARSSVILVARA